MLNNNWYIVIGLLTWAFSCLHDMFRGRRVTVFRAFVLWVMAVFWIAWVWFAIASLLCEGLRHVWDREQEKKDDKKRRAEERKKRREKAVTE